MYMYVTICVFLVGVYQLPREKWHAELSLNKSEFNLQDIVLMSTSGKFTHLLNYSTFVHMFYMCIQIVVNQYRKFL